jgi:hypothetical protein
MLYLITMSKRPERDDEVSRAAMTLLSFSEDPGGGNNSRHVKKRRVLALQPSTAGSVSEAGPAEAELEKCYFPFGFRATNRRGRYVIFPLSNPDSAGSIESELNSVDSSRGWVPVLIAPDGTVYLARCHKTIYKWLQVMMIPPVHLFGQKKRMVFEMMISVRSQTLTTTVDSNTGNFLVHMKDLSVVKLSIDHLEQRVYVEKMTDVKTFIPFFINPMEIRQDSLQQPSVALGIRDISQKIVFFGPDGRQNKASSKEYILQGYIQLLLQQLSSPFGRKVAKVEINGASFQGNSWYIHGVRYLKKRIVCYFIALLKRDPLTGKYTQHIKNVFAHLPFVVRDMYMFWYPNGQTIGVQILAKEPRSRKFKRFEIQIQGGDGETLAGLTIRFVKGDTLSGRLNPATSACTGVSFSILEQGLIPPRVVKLLEMIKAVSPGGPINPVGLKIMVEIAMNILNSPSEIPRVGSPDWKDEKVWNALFSSFPGNLDHYIEKLRVFRELRDKEKVYLFTVIKKIVHFREIFAKASFLHPSINQVFDRRKDLTKGVIRLNPLLPK